jgi:hypothetical protein
MSSITTPINRDGSATPLPGSPQTMQNAHRLSCLYIAAVLRAEHERFPGYCDFVPPNPVKVAPDGSSSFGLMLCLAEYTKLQMRTQILRHRLAACVMAVVQRAYPLSRAEPQYQLIRARYRLCGYRFSVPSSVAFPDATDLPANVVLAELTGFEQEAHPYFQITSQAYRAALSRAAFCIASDRIALHHVSRERKRVGPREA